MKKLIMTLGLIVSIEAICQTTNSSNSSSKETSITSVSTDDVSSRSSITRSKGSYAFDAKYDKKKYEGVKELLLDQLGTSYLQVNGKTHTWSKEVNGKEFFSCSLTNRELHLNLNLMVSSYDFADQIEELGDDLRDLIQMHEPHSHTPHTPATPHNPNSTDPQLIDNEIRQAELALERAQENLARLKKKKN